jgi:hypothetical protein
VGGPGRPGCYPGCCRGRALGRRAPAAGPGRVDERCWLRAAKGINEPFQLAFVSRVCKTWMALES